MAGTVLGSAIDYLVTLFTTATTGMQLGAGPVAVYDAMPETTEALDFITVGSDASTGSTATRDFVLLGLGPNSRQEEFDVVCMVQSSRGGSTEQKTTRDAASAMFAACEQAITADVTLGGLLRTFPAQITTQTLTQTQPDQASAGRGARIEFAVRIKNRY